MLFQVTDEGKAEAETYDKFACFCKDKSNAKVDSIATRESDITTLTADLEQLKAEKVELKADIKKLNEDLATSRTFSFSIESVVFFSSH